MGCVEAVWQLGFAVTVLACRNYVDVTQATASRSSMDALEESVLGSKSNVLLRVSRVRADGRCSGRVSELFS